MDLKRREFLELTQGRMDLQAYGLEFNHLSRYAPRDVTSDEDRQYLFRKGPEQVPICFLAIFWLLFV